MESVTATHYGTGRRITLLVEIFGWVVAVLGVILVLIGFFVGVDLGTYSRDTSFLGRVLGAMPGLFFVLSGFVLVMQAQVNRATLDNADHSRLLVALLSERGRPSPRESPASAYLRRPSTEHPEVAPASAALAGPMAPPRDSPQSALTLMVRYKSKEIRYDSAKTTFIVDGERFSSMEDAKAYVDRTA